MFPQTESFTYYFSIMATTKLDKAYSVFIMEVVPLLSGMYSQELTSLLNDITKRMDSEIDWALESELYSEARKESEWERNQMLRDDAEEEPQQIGEDDYPEYVMPT